MSTSGIDGMSREQLLAEVERLTRERDERAAAMIHVNRWGLALTEQLAKFAEACLESKRPLTTTLYIEFPDMPAQPVLRLWATTDEQSPVTRLAVIAEEREQARAEVERLRGLLNKAALARVAPPDGQGVGR